ncbi:Agglutinin-like protein 1 precursor [Sarracenia purpurea var. burkii]
MVLYLHSNLAAMSGFSATPRVFIPSQISLQSPHRNPCFSLCSSDMAATAPNTTISKPPSITHSKSRDLCRFTILIPSKSQRSTLRRPLHISNVHSNPKTTDVVVTTTAGGNPEPFVSRFAADEPRKGSDVLVEALKPEGVTNVFAYPGGASMEIHQALTCSSIIRNILPRHEQGGIFAAEGYARASGLTGVCIATSGPGATNLVSGLADAMLDSVPIVAITGQVPRRMIGTDAFQETPIVEVTRSIIKHNYLILDVEEIPRIVREAFFLASSGRPARC